MDAKKAARLSLFLFVILFTVATIGFSSSNGSGGKSNTLGMKFFYIEPGAFMMGSPQDEPGRDSNETQHKVTLTQGYYMQTTPVTQGQWEAVMEDNPSFFDECGDDCPVEMVSWNDAQDFIAKLNDLEDTNRYALPTEAQWEYAARAGSTTAFANGEIAETRCGYEPNLNVMGWYCGNSSVSYIGCLDISMYGGPKCAGTQPVAKKQPNDWGLYDMHGNVWEWMSDFYGNYPSSAVVDPTGPVLGTERVIRGGSWSGVAMSSRSACRYGFGPAYRYETFGFRLILLPEL